MIESGAYLLAQSPADPVADDRIAHLAAHDKPHAWRRQGGRPLNVVHEMTVTSLVVHSLVIHSHTVDNKRTAADPASTATDLGMLGPGPDTVPNGQHDAGEIAAR